MDAFTDSLPKVTDSNTMAFLDLAIQRNGGTTNKLYINPSNSQKVWNLTIIFTDSSIPSDHERYQRYKVLPLHGQKRILGVATNEGDYYLQHQQRCSVHCLHELCYLGWYKSMLFTCTLSPQKTRKNKKTIKQINSIAAYSLTESVPPTKKFYFLFIYFYFV